MYPLLSRRSHLPAYLLVWTLAGWLLAIVLSVEGGLGWRTAAAVAVPAALAYAFICLSSWYVARAMPLAGTSTVRVVATALGAASLSSATWLLLGRAWAAALSPRAPSAPEAVASVQPVLFGLGVLLYLLALAVSYVLVFFETAQETEREVFRGQVLAREAELRALRAQIDPHFLFNSLHSISALTAADPAGARRMCLLLAEVLRESIALGSEDRISLARELSLADRFLAVERIRFGSRLTADIDAGDAGECQVPPLLLQPLVENAVTHGIAHCLDGGAVRVTARRDAAWLRLTIENPCDPDRPRRAGTGVGLANVRARLRALHGADAAVIAGEEGGRWRVDLTLPVVTKESL